jgi:hypothetical protein
VSAVAHEHRLSPPLSGSDPKPTLEGSTVRWRSAVRDAVCIVVIGFVMGFFEGVSPDGDPSVAFRSWAAGNVAFISTVAVLFFAVATQELTQSLRQAFAALGLYTLISIGIGLVMSAWVPSPLIMVLIDWLAVVMGALAGTAIGVWIRVVKARQRRMSASGR